MGTFSAASAAFVVATADGAPLGPGVEALLLVGIPIVLILLGLIVGRLVERAHLRSLKEREGRMTGFLTTNFRKAPESWNIQDAWLVAGEVVIASDYFKSFGAKLKNLIGGHLRTLETLLMRARREALLRLQESARKQGADAVMNVRFETSVIGRLSGNKKGVPPVEILSYGTAVKFAADPATPSA